MGWHQFAAYVLQCQCANKEIHRQAMHMFLRLHGLDQDPAAWLILMGRGVRRAHSCSEVVCLLMQVRLRLSVFSFFVLSIVLLFFVNNTACRSFVDTWLGLLPLHVSLDFFLPMYYLCKICIKYWLHSALVAFGTFTIHDPPQDAACSYKYPRSCRHAHMLPQFERHAQTTMLDRLSTFRLSKCQSYQVKSTEACALLILIMRQAPVLTYALH